MPIYNKLIRDQIPSIMDSENKDYTVRTLTNEEYKRELQRKCSEELNEYLSSNEDGEALGELSDLLEVIYALACVHGSTPEELESIRKEKALKRGGFNDRVFLVEVRG